MAAPPPSPSPVSITISTFVFVFVFVNPLPRPPPSRCASSSQHVFVFVVAFVFASPVTNAILEFVFVFVFVSRSSLSLYLLIYRIITTICNCLCHFVFITGEHLNDMSLCHYICVWIGFHHCIFVTDAFISPPCHMYFYFHLNFFCLYICDRIFVTGAHLHVPTSTSAVSSIAISTSAWEKEQSCQSRACYRHCGWGEWGFAVAGVI